MVKQTITYSDGSETVINYRGVIVDGVLVPEKQDTTHMSEEEVKQDAEIAAPEASAEEVAGPVETPAEEKSE